MEPISREDMKAACMARLDAVAVEHPAGHQGKYAARYVMRTTGGDPVELMFEKGSRGPANLWLTERHARPLLSDELDYRQAPAGAIGIVTDAEGKKIYGRHSALKPMRELGSADLVCIRLKDVAELDRILCQLRAG